MGRIHTALLAPHHRHADLLLRPPRRAFWHSGWLDAYLHAGLGTNGCTRPPWRQDKAARFAGGSSLVPDLCLALSVVLLDQWYLQASVQRTKHQGRRTLSNYIGSCDILFRTE